MERSGVRGYVYLIFLQVCERLDAWSLFFINEKLTFFKFSYKMSQKVKLQPYANHMKVFWEQNHSMQSKTSITYKWVDILIMEVGWWAAIFIGN